MTCGTWTETCQPYTNGQLITSSLVFEGPKAGKYEWRRAIYNSTSQSLRVPLTQNPLITSAVFFGVILFNHLLNQIAARVQHATLSPDRHERLVDRLQLHRRNECALIVARVYFLLIDNNLVLQPIRPIYFTPYILQVSPGTPAAVQMLQANCPCGGTWQQGVARNLTYCFVGL